MFRTGHTQGQSNWHDGILERENKKKKKNQKFKINFFVFFFLSLVREVFLLFVNDELKVLNSDFRFGQKRTEFRCVCVGCDVTSGLPVVRSNIDNFDETFDWEIFDLYTNCVQMFFFCCCCCLGFLPAIATA
jgi:hypothetical protein